MLLRVTIDGSSVSAAVSHRDFYVLAQLADFTPKIPADGVVGEWKGIPVRVEAPKKRLKKP